MSVSSPVINKPGTSFDSICSVSSLRGTPPAQAWACSKPLVSVIFTGKCFVKDYDEGCAAEVKKSVERESFAIWLDQMFYSNLGPSICPERMIKIKDIVLKLLETE